MRKYILMLCTIAVGLTCFSCDDSTDGIGATLIDVSDKLNVKADTFDITSRTIMAEDIFARSSYGYIGRIQDPETNSIITGNYINQFNILNNYDLPEKSKIKSLDSNGEIIADSCEIRLFYDSFYGDTLAQIKINMYEMDKPLEENQTYTTAFDPEQNQIVRNNGLFEAKTYTLVDQSETTESKKSEGYQNNIHIKMNKPYTDKSGKVYNNYGTYLMRKYSENPQAFRNVYNFVHNICPGFYYKVVGGLGSMARIKTAQLSFYFKLDTGDTIKTVTSRLTSTEEVIQMTYFNTDKTQLQQIANSPDYTMIKSPAGLFTELTLPIENIIKEHKNDTINTAKIQLKRFNNTVTSGYNLALPENILMVPKDSLKRFFENNKLADNKTSYLATYSPKTNSYTFNNISGIINLFEKTIDQKTSNPNWSKVVLVPVDVKTTTTKDYNQNEVIKIIKISHNMGLSSVKLLGHNNSQKIKMSIIYSKFNGR